MIKSGRLRRAIRPRSSGDYAIVTNDVPYAALHNEGGQITATQQVSAHARNRYEEEEVSRPGELKARYVKKKTGSHQVKAHERKLDTTMPARPFMVTTPDLENELEQHFFDEIDKFW